MIRTVSAVAAALATVGLVAFATPALADMRDTQSITVTTSDLDMNSPAHRARLKARVGRAADKVCGYADSRGVTASKAFRDCRAAAIRGALGE